MSYRSVYSSLNKIEIYGEMARNVFFKNILFYGEKTNYVGLEFRLIS